jgi:hypothetical protein
MNLPCLEELEPVLSLFEGTLLSKYFVGVLIKLYKGEQSNTDLTNCQSMLHIYSATFYHKPKKSSQKNYKTTLLGNNWHVPIAKFQNVHGYVYYLLEETFLHIVGEKESELYLFPLGVGSFFCLLS